MSTIKLATAYQLVLTSLLVGACLGILGRQLPNVFADTLLSVQAMDVIEPVAFAQPPSPNAEANTRSELALTTSDQPDANVQIEVEVHTTDGASAVARAMGPNDTEVKTDTNGEGHGRAVARLDGTLSLVGSASSQLNGATNATIQPQVNSMQSNAPIAVVQADLANLRSAPSISSPIVGHSMRNQQFKIVGRDLSNSWWLVCCYNNQMVWISGDVVNAQGATAAVEVIYSELNVVGSASANSLPSNTVDNSNSSQSAGTNDQVVAAPPTYEYELVEQRQHGEQVTPRIFLYVHDTTASDREAGIGGLALRVKKDGVELPITKQTHAGRPDFTWPLPSDRQRLTNLKLEFPNITATGVWEMQLIDGDGRAVGPVARFVFAPNEPNQEMYVRYQK